MKNLFQFRTERMDHSCGAFCRIRNENSEGSIWSNPIEKGQSIRGLNLFSPDRSSFERNMRIEQSDFVLNITLPVLSDLPYYSRSAGKSE